MRWYRRVFNEIDPLKQMGIICQACEEYEGILPTLLNNLECDGKVIVSVSSQLPSWAAYAEAIVKDLEIMLHHLENYENTVKTRKQQYLMEHYPRSINENVAKSYADIDDEVQSIRTVRYHVSSISDQFMAVTKGMNYLHFQIGNIVKLRSVGIEDAEF